MYYNLNIQVQAYSINNERGHYQQQYKSNQDQRDHSKNQSFGRCKNQGVSTLLLPKASVLSFSSAAQKGLPTRTYFGQNIDPPQQKEKLHRSLHTRQKLQNKVHPPLSIRFKAELTSPEPKVAASPEFADYREDFNESIANCIEQCKALFVKTKDLEVEMATKELQRAFTQHFHRIIEVMTQHEIGIMINTTNIDNIENNGGNKILTAIL